jgi:hypothetical protein
MFYLISVISNQISGSKKQTFNEFHRLTPHISVKSNIGEPCYYSEDILLFIYIHNLAKLPINYTFLPFIGMGGFVLQYGRTNRILIILGA